MGVAFHRRTDDAPGLARANHEIVFRIVVAACEGMFIDGRIADGVFRAGFVAPAGGDAAFIDFDEIAHTFEHPFDAAIAARLPFIVINRGDDDILRPDLVGRLNRADFQAERHGDQSFGNIPG